MPECRNCSVELEPKLSGFAALLSRSRVEGYECTGCGAALCTECRQEMSINAFGGGEVTCGTCGGTWEPR
ncbi:hypothetical protein [Natronomonas gomsonensis]|uniref:hypothetical protein n=1 Tax=Natronomonas gomsonensis TaxID=1046043 RepID=UPI0015BCB60B|nr:hypothetical protein [Natronomonas gomsonensis]